MAKANPDVLAMVERALKKDPSIPSTDLRERAAKMDAAVKKLSGRQFHAQYTLPVRRKLPGGSQSRKRARGGSRRRAPKSVQTNGDVMGVLTQTFDGNKARLTDAVDAAFQRAIDADSVNQINRLVSLMGRWVTEAGKV